MVYLFRRPRSGNRKVKRVFGVSELCVVSEVEADLEAIEKQALLELLDTKAETFKVETNRANKAFSMNSMEVSRTVGAYILENSQGISVDVNKP